MNFRHLLSCDTIVINDLQYKQIMSKKKNLVWVGLIVLFYVKNKQINKS